MTFKGGLWGGQDELVGSLCSTTPGHRQTQFDTEMTCKAPRVAPVAKEKAVGAWGTLCEKQGWLGLQKEVDESALGWRPRQVKNNLLAHCVAP